ncbi:Metallo-dependent phosphatase-like protein [Baffinella frigidus]|nr:Metallo-dependent phosphatase-like protein [Cryptophyta sp. CCMP2293]
MLLPGEVGQALPLHHASVGQLESQTRYYYQVGRKGLYRDSVFSFRTPVAPGVAPKKGVRPEVAANPDHPPLTIYTIGDIGQTDNSLRTRDMILSRYGQTAGEGFALIIGDLAYADGGADRWDSFGRLMEPLLSAMPLMVLPGNHEIEVDATHETFLPYRHRYNMPEVLPEKTAPIRNGMWKGRPVADMSYEGGSSFYSFEVGYVHFLMLNTYDTHGGLDGNENAQAEFAAADLASERLA